MKEDKISIYDDRGKVVAENISIDALSPYKNRAIKEILQCTIRTAIVDMEKLENNLREASIGGTMGIGSECCILGKEIDLPIVENIDAISEKVKKIIENSLGYSSRVEVVDSTLVIQLPPAIFDVTTDYSQTYFISATAVAQSIVDDFNLGIFDGIDTIKAALLGRYPQETAPSGAVSTLLNFPTKIECPGNAYRSISVNDVVALAGRRTFDAVALSSIFEHGGAFDSGSALHTYKRFHLLGLAYQGLNANNLVYEIVRDNGRGGATADVVRDVVRRAEENGVIKIEKKLPSGYELYSTKDSSLWNAYAAAGLLASTIINAGSSLSLQGAPSTMVFYNDLLSIQTSLPSVDFGRALGTATIYNFLTHNTYGGGEVGIFSGEHVATRGSKGFIMPCACAAVCLDAGTTMYPPEMTSKNIFKIRKVLPEIKDPVKKIAAAASEMEGVKK